MLVFKLLIDEWYLFCFGNKGGGCYICCIFIGRCEIWLGFLLLEKDGKV